jgi:hypothetical protein
MQNFCNSISLWYIIIFPLIIVPLWHEFKKQSTGIFMGHTDIFKYTMGMLFYPDQKSPYIL